LYGEKCHCAEHGATVMETKRVIKNPRSFVMLLYRNTPVKLVFPNSIPVHTLCQRLDRLSYFVAVTLCHMFCVTYLPNVSVSRTYSHTSFSMPSLQCFVDGILLPSLGFWTSINLIIFFKKKHKISQN